MAVPEKNRPSVDSVLSRPVRRTASSTGSHHTASPTARTRPVRPSVGRSSCSASSLMSGAGPSSSITVDVMEPGRCRPSSQPTTPAASTTSGNGTPKNANDANASTAMATSAGLPRARRPMRTTACATMASTAGAMPANRPVTAVVSPKATYTADSAPIASAPGSTNSVPAISPPRTPLSSQPTYTASWVASGPGRIVQKFRACRNRPRPIHRRSSTSVRCMTAIWPAGPPKDCRATSVQTFAAVRSGTTSCSLRRTRGSEQDSPHQVKRGS